MCGVPAWTLERRHAGLTVLGGAKRQGEPVGRVDPMTSRRYVRQRAIFGRFRWSTAEGRHRGRGRLVHAGSDWRRRLRSDDDDGERSWRHADIGRRDGRGFENRGCLQDEPAKQLTETTETCEDAAAVRPGGFGPLDDGGVAFGRRCLILVLDHVLQAAVFGAVAMGLSTRVENRQSRSRTPDECQDERREPVACTQRAQRGRPAHDSPILLRVPVVKAVQMQRLCRKSLP
jgi:hypothetical protein